MVSGVVDDRSMNGIRLGRLVRAVRVRKRMTQRAVSRLAGVSPTTISRLERGWISSLTLRTVERIATALEIQVDITGRWRGADGDRLVNAGHAALHEAIAQRFAVLREWVTFPEVSFSVYGERGVIDLLAYHAASGCLLVIELKTALVDPSALMGPSIGYRRLAARHARDHGWTVRSVSVWVLMHDTPTNHRHVAQHVSVLRAAFPMDGRGVRRWLRRPDGPIRALSFMAIAGATGAAPARVRPPRRPDVDRLIKLPPGER